MWQIAAWSNRNQSNARSVPPTPVAEKLVADGLENLWKLPLSDGQVLYSGGQPQGATGFHSLQSLGVRTVISVDGARPEVELAKSFGLRYVHLPIGYDDVPPARRLALIQAVRELPGPVYVHCHHGKHRGPSAAVCIWRGLGPHVSAEQGTETLHEMGTAENYRGLYLAVMQDPPRSSALQADKTTFPEVTAVRPLAEEMVAIDHDWEQLQPLGKQESLTTEQSQRAQELLVGLAERFRESARLLEAESPAAAADLHDALASASDEILTLGTDQQGAARLKADLPRLEQRCAACHARFRD